MTRLQIFNFAGGPKIITETTTPGSSPPNAAIGSIAMSEDGSWWFYGNSGWQGLPFNTGASANVANAGTSGPPGAGMTTATALNVTSTGSIGKGTYLIHGNVCMRGVTTGSILEASFSTASATLQNTLGYGRQMSANMPTATADTSLHIGPWIVSSGGGVTIYLVAKATFTIGSPSVYGSIIAQCLYAL